MRRQNNARIEHANKKRRQKALKKSRRLRAHYAKINDSREHNLGQNKAKPNTMKLPSAQAMRRKGSAG